MSQLRYALCFSIISANILLGASCGKRLNVCGSEIFSLAADGVNVYWRDQDGIQAAEETGDTPQTIFLGMPMALDDPRKIGIRARSGKLFWWQSAKLLTSGPTGDGIREIPTLSGGATFFDADQNNVYYQVLQAGPSGMSHQLFRTSIDSGQSILVSGDLTAHMLLVHNGTIYFDVDPGVDPGNAGIWSLPITGGPPSQLARETASVFSMDANDAQVFWTTYDGRLRSVDLAATQLGATTYPMATAATLVSANLEGAVWAETIGGSTNVWHMKNGAVDNTLAATVTDTIRYLTSTEGQFVYATGQCVISNGLP